MTRKIFQLLSLGLILFGITACKQEKKSNDIITKIAPKPKVPSGPQPMTDFKYEKKIEWMGSTYTIRIHRFADKSLSIVSDEDGRKYYDNKFQVQDSSVKMVHLFMSVHLRKMILENTLITNMVRMVH